MYTKTVWQDRVVQNPLTYQLQSNSDGTTTLVPAPGTVTQSGTPVNAGNLNNIETAVESMVGKDNTTVGQRTALILETDTRNTVETYTNGLLTQVVEQDGATVIRTTNLTYTNGLLTQVQEIAGGKTVTTTISYTNGVMSGTSKTVS